MRTQTNKHFTRHHLCPGRSWAGYTLVELLVVITIAVILSIMAIPMSRAALASYQLTSAVDSATGAIQATRYQAIMHGYTYQLSFIPGTQTKYQVLSMVPPLTTFANVGNEVPLSGAPIALSAATTLQFKPNGSVSATVGLMTFSISYNGTTKTLTVSNYGSISVQ